MAIAIRQTILAVGFIDELAVQSLKNHGGFVQSISSVPPINLVFLPHRSNVARGETRNEWDCIISFPDGKGNEIEMDYERHLDITQSRIFLNELDYPNLIA